MVKVTNLTREEQSFNTTGKADKDGNAPTASIPPGETVDADFDTENARFRGYVIAGAITAPDSVARKAGAPEPAPTTRTK